MKNEILLGNGVGAGPGLWFKNPVEFTHLDLSSESYHHRYLFTHHYGQHNNAILPTSYLKQIESMTVKQWHCDYGDGLVVFPSRYHGINESIVNFYKDENCIVWLGYDRKILRNIAKTAKIVCEEYYPCDDTSFFLRLIKSQYTKEYGATPWVSKDSL